MFHYTRMPEGVLPLPRTVDDVSTPGRAFELDIRTDSQGRKTLHFAFQSISDIHWGSYHTRARKLAHMLMHTSADAIYLAGDIIDGEHLLTKKRWKFPEWHRQGVAALLRKAERGSRITYIPGNHDAAMRARTIMFDGRERPYRDLYGKKIFGIEVAHETIYADLFGFRLKIEHSDKHDKTLGSCGAIGNMLLDMMAYADRLVQHIPGCDHISLAAKGKRAVKTVIDRFWSIRRNIAEEIDNDPSADGVLVGHSHMSAMGVTPGGKKFFNDGSCTENVEMVAQDKNGAFALLEWHYGHLKITEENGNVRKLGWNELGLDTFTQRLELKDQIEDSATEKADRLMRLFYRVWPPRERMQMRKIWEMQRQGESIVRAIMSAGHIPLPAPRRQPIAPIPLARRYG